MKYSIALLLLAFTQSAHAQTVVPIWSETSFDAAAKLCAAQKGSTVGIPMETTTATQNEFFIQSCLRQSENGPTYTVAWSASSADNAVGRCETDSYTTGLPAGVPAGAVVHAKPSVSDIFIVNCQI